MGSTATKTKTGGGTPARTLDGASLVWHAHPRASEKGVHLFI
jgi:hypothetical protein